MAYASKSEFAEYSGIPYDSQPDNINRLLERASELLDYYTAGNYSPANAAHVAAMQLAVCQQVEMWLEQGGDSEDVIGSVQGYRIGSVSVSRAEQAPAPVLAPRARRTLLPLGLLYMGVTAR